MTKELRKALMWWWEHRPIKDQAHVFLCLDETAFTKEYYGKPLLKRQHFMRRMCKKAGVKQFGFHGIRHLTSTILYRLGYQVKDIQPLLRHKSPRTTEIYLEKLGMTSLRSVVESIPYNSGTDAVIIPFKNEGPSTGRQAGRQQ
jgi:integrase